MSHLVSLGSDETGKTSEVTVLISRVFLVVVWITVPPALNVAAFNQFCFTYSWVRPSPLSIFDPAAVTTAIVDPLHSSRKDRSDRDEREPEKSITIMTPGWRRTCVRIYSFYSKKDCIRHPTRTFLILEYINLHYRRSLDACKPSLIMNVGFPKIPVSSNQLPGLFFVFEISWMLYNLIRGGGTSTIWN